MAAGAFFQSILTETVAAVPCPDSKLWEETRSSYARQRWPLQMMVRAAVPLSRTEVHPSEGKGLQSAASGAKMSRDLPLPHPTHVPPPKMIPLESPPPLHSETGFTL